MKPATRKLFSLEDLKKLGRTSERPVSHVVASEKENKALVNTLSGRDSVVNSTSDKTEGVSPTCAEHSSGECVYSQFGQKPVFHYEEGASLCLPEHDDSEEIKLLAIEEVGIPSHASLDSTIELGFGLDFGTSSVKVVIHNKNEHESFPVPFLDNKTGIAAYLLPSVLYVTFTGNCSLTVPKYQGNFARFSSLKLDLLNNRNSREAQDRAVAFLALVIRQVRAWLFTRYPKFASELIEWNVCIGVPSNQQDKDLIKLWRRLLVAAWNVAGEECRVSLFHARRSLNTIANDCYDEEGTQFSSISEIVSETIAFLENHPQKSASQDYLIIDVGSGTFDMACFSLSQAETYYKTDLGHTVCWLGTTNIHHSRLCWLKSALQNDSKFPCTEKKQELLYQWTKEIDSELQRTLRTPLVNETKEYLKGISPVGDGIIEVDETLKKEISHTVSGLKDKLWKEGKLPLSRIAKLQIFLCGGGAVSEFYRKSISFVNDFIKSRSWARNDNLSIFQGIGTLRPASEYPITLENHSRLIVACGLSYFREVQECTLQHESEPQINQSDYTDRFVGKDLI